MRGFKATLLGFSLGLARVLNANAADLPPPSVAPIYIPPPAFTWAGPYLGATVGFANGFHSYDDLAGAFLGYPGLSNDQSKGFAAGGTLGFNLQAGSFVYGLEADLSWLNNKSTYVDPNGAINNFYPSETNRLNDLGTVRGRLGLAVSPILERARQYWLAHSLLEMTDDVGDQPVALGVVHDLAH